METVSMLIIVTFRVTVKILLFCSKHSSSPLHAASCALTSASRPPGLLLWYPRGPRGPGLLLPLQPHLHRKAPRLPPKYLHRFFLSLPLRCSERPFAASPRFHRGPRKYLRPPSAVAVSLLLRFDRNSVPRGSNCRCSRSDSNRCSNLRLWILI